MAQGFLAGRDTADTGNFGTAAVAVALAMGTGHFLAPGRNEAAMADLARRFGPRLRIVKLGGNEDEDRQRMLAAAPGGIDCVLDILPPSVTTTTVRAALMTVRPNGRVILMGGVGMLGGAGLELPYRGSCGTASRSTACGCIRPRSPLALSASLARACSGSTISWSRNSIWTTPTRRSRTPPPTAARSR
jgi:Zn-dependent alcohol dehydrogenase